MRRAVLTAALAVLGVLVGARASLATPEQAAAARMDSWGPEGYNVLDLALPVSTQTAGSALVAEMDCYYLGRAPTAKNVYTGRLAGQNLILILAENWTVPSLEPKQAPGAYRLWSEAWSKTVITLLLSKISSQPSAIKISTRSLIMSLPV